MTAGLLDYRTSICTGCIQFIFVVVVIAWLTKSDPTNYNRQRPEGLADASDVHLEDSVVLKEMTDLP